MADNDLELLYQELLMDHFRTPRRKVEILNPTHSYSLRNPLCGDQVKISLKIEGDKISDCGFEGHGCAISQASASMLAENLIGKKVEDAKRIIANFKRLLDLSNQELSLNQNELDELGDAASLQGVRKFAARLKCALLAWEASEKSGF
jgi:nitrogen fixation NifU-like protein